MAGTLCITVDSPRLILLGTSSENRSIFRSCIFFFVASCFVFIGQRSITSMDQIELGTIAVAFEGDEETTAIAANLPSESKHFTDASTKSLSTVSLRR